MGMKEILKGAAKVVLSDVEHNDYDLFQQRISTCEGCDKFNAEERTCGVCGCFMDIKAGLTTNRNPEKNLRIEFTHCPLGRWNDKHIANYYRLLDNISLL